MLNFIGNQFKRPEGLMGRLVSFLMKRGNLLAYVNLIKELEIRQGDKILEIGYGHGIGIDMICSEHNCFVTGIDFSELMFKEANERNQQHIADKKVNLNFGDYLSFINENESFDKIFFINVIYFWDNLSKPFLKIRKELKEDGMLCIYMAHQDHLKKIKFTVDEIFNKYAIEHVVEELKSAGFGDITFNFNNGYYIKCKKHKISVSTLD
jgi:cyclopropane fatty-acyl-phospholipid synthase-like methyltransferase